MCVIHYIIFYYGTTLTNACARGHHIQVQLDISRQPLGQWLSGFVPSDISEHLIFTSLYNCTTPYYIFITLNSHQDILPCISLCLSIWLNINITRRQTKFQSCNQPTICNVIGKQHSSNWATMTSSTVLNTELTAMSAITPAERASVHWLHSEPSTEKCWCSCIWEDWL